VARLLSLLVTTALLTASVACSGRDSGDREGAAATAGTARPAAAVAFLQAYVRSDGRVSRPDQGDDTVSEGQAYGLLLAEVADDDAAFGRIWWWTREHLQRADGLLAYHADMTGRVLDEQPASDADLLIAWALLRHAGPDADSHHADGRRVAAAVLAHETAIGPTGDPVLTAGPWATARPVTLNPSYWSVDALSGLAELTGDARWRRLAEGVVPLAERLTDAGRLLPPDWAELAADGSLRPVPAPGGAAPRAQYGLDAQRLVVWLATSCDGRARRLAAGWWAQLRRDDRAGALTLRLDGEVLDPRSNALPLVAAAAAAAAAGDPASRDRLLARADEQQRRYPTYYGGAWAALGRSILSGDALRSC